MKQMFLPSKAYERYRDRRRWRLRLEPSWLRDRRRKFWYAGPQPTQMTAPFFINMIDREYDKRRAAHSVIAGRGRPVAADAPRVSAERRPTLDHYA